MDSEFRLDTSIYRLSAIKKAAYRYGSDFRVELSHAEPPVVIVRLIPLTENAPSSISAQSFLSEVLDQELREQVAEETAGVRDVLLAQAFSGLSLVDDVGENADFREDPLRIDLSDRHNQKAS